MAPRGSQLGLAILGGQEIGQDYGYGPARSLDPDQGRLVAGALAAVDHDWCRSMPNGNGRSVSDTRKPVGTNRS
jgi:hypothetical protein